MAGPGAPADLPREASAELPWLVQAGYSCVWGLFEYLEEEPSDPALLFDVFLTLYSIVDAPEDYIGAEACAPDQLPWDLASLLYRVWKSDDMQMPPVSSEVSAAVARTLSLEWNWEDHEEGSGVILYSLGDADAEAAKNMNPRQSECAVYDNRFREPAQDEDFETLLTVLDACAGGGGKRRGQALVEAFSQSLSGARSFESFEGMLAWLGAANVGVGGGEWAAAASLANELRAGDGQLCAVGGSVLAQLEFEEGRKPGHASARAARTLRLLANDPLLAALVQMVAAQHVLDLVRDEAADDESAEAALTSVLGVGFKLAPVLIQQSPGQPLDSLSLESRPVSFETLIAAAVPLARSVLPSEAMSLVDRGCSTAGVVRDHLTRRRTPFVLWLCTPARGLSLRQFLQRDAQSFTSDEIQAWLEHLPTSQLQRFGGLQMTKSPLSDQVQCTPHLTNPLLVICVRVGLAKAYFQPQVLSTERPAGVMVLLAWDPSFVACATSALSALWQDSQVLAGDCAWEHAASTLPEGE